MLTCRQVRLKRAGIVHLFLNEVLRYKWNSGKELLAGTSAGSEFVLQRLQFFAGFEADGAAGLDVDLLAGPGIASDAGLAGLDVENTEAAQLDAFAASERVLERLKHRFDGLLGLAARHVGALHHCIDDIQFD